MVKKEYILANRPYHVLFSSNCGEIYRRVTWSNHGKKNIVWRCCTRVENWSECCNAESIQEEEL